MLELIDNQICAVRYKTHITVDRISAAQAMQYWLQLRHSPQVATAIANGALHSSVETIALARRIGLLAPIDTTEARLKLLLK